MTWDQLSTRKEDTGQSHRGECRCYKAMLQRWVASVLDRDCYLSETSPFSSRTIHWPFQKVSVFTHRTEDKGLTWRQRVLLVRVSSFTGVYLSSSRKARRFRPNTKRFGEDGRLFQEESP